MVIYRVVTSYFLVLASVTLEGKLWEVWACNAVLFRTFLGHLNSLKLKSMWLESQKFEVEAAECSTFVQKHSGGRANSRQ